jgi:hypothetical protein
MFRSKPFTWIASAFFALGAIVHVIRLFTHFQVIIGSHHIPEWASYIAIPVAALFSWMLCREARGVPPGTP